MGTFSFHFVSSVGVSPKKLLLTELEEGIISVSLQVIQVTLSGVMGAPKFLSHIITVSW